MDLKTPDASDGLFGGKGAVMSTTLNDVSSTIEKNPEHSAEEPVAQSQPAGNAPQPIVFSW